MAGRHSSGQETEAAIWHYEWDYRYNFETYSKNKTPEFIGAKGNVKFPQSPLLNMVLIPD
jgi:hypothetical protein